MSGGIFHAQTGAGEAAAVASAFAELAILSLAVFALLRRRGRTDAEAAACALFLPLMVLSCLFQLAFLIGLPGASIPLEIAAVCFGLHRILKDRRLLAAAASTAAAGLGRHRIAALGLAAAGAYLLLQALIIPPDVTSWKSLAPMALVEREKSFFLTAPFDGGLLLDPLADSLNGPILFHLLFRLGTDRGLGLFGFLAYAAVGFATYALARRYAWPPTAFTAALVVLSLPRLVVQATGPGVEMMAAAAALLCLMSLYRLLERPNSGDLTLMVLFVLFSIAGGPMPLTFPLVLSCLAAILLYRRHGGRIWLGIVSSHRLWIAAAALAAAVFSQLWRFFARAAEGLEIAAGAGLTPNTGGLAGAVANGARYLLESIHLTLPAEHAGRWLFGFSPMAAIEGLYGLAAGPLLGGLGAAAPFRLRWLPDESLAWFGPFGFLLVLPAVGYALWWGPRRIKAIAIGLAVYAYLVALVPAWQPGNARLFTFFFVCGGFCISFLLPPWRLTTVGRHVLQGMSFAVMVYAAALNTSKPAVGYADWVALLYGADETLAAESVTDRTRQSFWRRIGQKRWDEAAGRWVFGDDRLFTLARLIHPEQPVGVYVSRPERLYPLLLRWRDVPLLLASPETPATVMRAAAPAYLLYLDVSPDRGGTLSGLRPLWRSPGGGALPGALFRMPPPDPLQAAALTAYRRGSPGGKSRIRCPGSASDSPCGRR